MKRTICQVIHYEGPTGGSFIPALESLSKAVIERGDRFLVYATEVPGATWPAELRAAGADLHLVRTADEVVGGLRRTRPAIIHSHFTRFDLSVLRASWNARIFWHFHSHREETGLPAKIKAIAKYRLIGRRVEALVPVSQSLGDECIAFFAPATFVHVVQNGIDTDRFRPPTPEERYTARESFGINKHDRIVLFFERVPYKGGATLRAALRRIPGFRLLVAGGGPADRDRFGSAPAVISVQRAADARQLYWAADVLAFPSDNEAFGFVLAEGLACGLPVAASDIPIVQEIAGDSNQVAVFPVRDSEAMAIAIQGFSTKQCWNGRERIVKHFDISRWTADMLRLYD